MWGRAGTTRGAEEKDASTTLADSLVRPEGRQKAVIIGVKESYCGNRVVSVESLNWIFQTVV